MGLTNKREEILKQMPLIRSTVSKSKDGKYVIHKTTFVHIKPTNYYEAVLAGSADDEVEELLATA